MGFQVTWGYFFKMAFLIVSYIVWPLTFLLWRMLKLVKPTREKVPKLKANKPLRIEKEKPPSFITHITDLHMKVKEPQSYVHIKEIFDIINKTINPDCVVLTGDIQDGRYGTSLFSKYGQNIASWQPFLDIVAEYPKMKLVTVAGNHDEIALPNVEHPSHIFLNEFRDGNVDEYFVQAHDIETTSGNVRLVAFNPFYFPYSPCPFGTFLTPTKEMLSDLKASLLPPNKAIFNLICMHNPQEALTNPEDYRKVANPDNNVRMTLCGHFHSPEAFSHVLGDCIETIGPCPEEGDSNLSFISIDNGVTNISCVDIKDMVAVVSCPPAAELFTTTNYYVPNNFRIRVSVYNKMPMNIEASIDGYSFGLLEVDCQTDNFITYGLDVTVNTNGYHVLTLSGSVNKVQNFIVGPESEENEIDGSSFYLRLKPLKGIAIAFNIWIYSLLLLPFILNAIEPIRSYMYKFENWLFHEGSVGTGSVYTDFLCGFIICPFYTIWRFSQANGILQANAIVTQLIHYFIPFYMRVERPTYAIMFLGAFFGSHYYFDRTTYIAEWFGTLGASFPLWLFASAVGDGTYFTSTHYLVIAFALILLLVGVWAIYALANMADGIRGFFTSPTLYRDIISFSLAIVGFLKSPALN